MPPKALLALEFCDIYEATSLHLTNLHFPKDIYHLFSLQVEIDGNKISADVCHFLGTNCLTGLVDCGKLLEQIGEVYIDLGERDGLRETSRETAAGDEEDSGEATAAD